MIEIDVKKQESLPPLEVESKFSLEPSDETLQELGQYLQKRFKRLKDLRERSDWERDKAFCFNAYHMVPKKRPLPFPGAANMSSPLPRIGVDSFHANVMSSLYSDENRMKVGHQIIQKDYVSKAKRASEYMTYVMNHEADSYMAIDDADKKAQMFGVGYLEPSYVKEEIWETIDVTEIKKMPQPNPLTGEIEMIEKKTTRKEKKKRTVFDGIKIKSLPVESIFRSPFLSFEDSLRTDSVFKVFQVSYTELVDKSKKRKGDDTKPFYKKEQVKKVQPFLISKIYKSQSELESARMDLDGFMIDLLNREESVEMCQGYCWYDIDNDGIKEEINATFHPDTGVVIRVSFSKCRIVDLNPRPIDERGYGEGIPLVTRNLDDEWENFHNSRSNAGQWENTTFGFYRAGGRFNPQQITIQPGHFYPVDDPREVNFAQTPRVGSSYFQEEQMILNYFERVLALDENMQGVGSAKKRTATESINVASRSSVRFGNPFNRIVTSVNKLLNHIWELNKECAPDEKEFYVLGEGNSPLFYKMQKYDYANNMKFSVSVTTVFDQQVVRDTMMLAYRLFLVNPIVQAHPEVIYDLSQKTLDVLDINVSLPKPPQAETVSAFEALDLLKSGEKIEPELGIDYDHHIKVCMSALNAEDIKEWDHSNVQNLVVYISKCQILKKTLESANLNKSGMAPQDLPQQPGVTSNRNPTQKFNTMKVGENGNSMRQNLKNGQQGQQGGTNVDQNMDQIMGQVA